MLITELRTDTGLVRLTDALALRAGADLSDDAAANRGELVRSAAVLSGSVRFGLDPESVAIELSGIGPSGRALVPLILVAELESADLPAYGRLLLDVFNRDPALSIRGDEAEESWRVVTPVLAAWEQDRVPLQEYAAGSDGPPKQLASVQS